MAGIPGVVKWHLVVATAFLLVSVTMASLAAVQLAWPGIFGSSALLSYGRLWPMAQTAFIYGWLTIGFFGAILYIVPRASGGGVRSSGLGYVGLAFATIGVVVGTAAIGLGMSTGRLMLEMPLIAAALLLVGAALVAIGATGAAARSERPLGPPQWYLLAAGWWLVLLLVSGNLPGVPGFNGAIQTAFYGAGLTGMWLAAAGVGVVYYVIPKLVGTDPMEPTPLGALGFWSLAFVWIGTGARSLVYGPGADWYETIGVAFSIALLVPVAVIFTDFALVTRGRWGSIIDRVSLRFVIAGAWLFALIPVYNLVLALRTSSAIVRFTQWIPAFGMLAYYGAFSMWLFAFAYFIHGRGRRRERAPGASWHLGYSLVGLGMALAAMTAGGVVAGFTWAAGVNSGLYDSVGVGFFNTSNALEPYYGVRAVGVVVFALAQILFVFNGFRAGDAEDEEEREGAVVGIDDSFDLQFDGGSGRPMTWRGLRWGVVILFLGAATFTWLLPSFDGDNTTATVYGDSARSHPNDSEVAEGRAVFLREGCWYCHTQEVRGIVTDVGLGPVSAAGDYADETPILLGVERIGPDLMHAGSRPDTDSVAWVKSYLADPQDLRPWSNSPSYAYLSTSDLDAVALYVTSLE